MPVLLLHYWSNYRIVIFRFKKFIIKQEKAAAKVGTDGVLLGAWANFPEKGEILDVGTGTGLIALSAAQRTACRIDAVEIEPAAFAEAKDNFLSSDFENPPRAILGDALDYLPNANKQYDYIVSNPPFFSGSLEAKDRARSRARHNGMLPDSDFLRLVAQNLAEEGVFGFILPTDRAKDFIQKAENYGLFCKRMCAVYPKPGKPVKRITAELCKEQTTCRKEKLLIELNRRHHYSPEYIALCQDFYLKM